MNWIEIDKMLYAMISRHTALDDIYIEAETQFTWSRSQSMAAIDPLLKRLDWKDHGGSSIKNNNTATPSTTSRGRKVRNKSKTTRK
tara:strand:+ start:687 stop:944 length:258 start_codon:yes stop_codon:yes gene_type:complete